MTKVSPRWPRLMLATLIAVIGIGGFSWLGVWQVQRLHWKLDLIERVEARIHAAPVPAPGPEAWAEIASGAGTQAEYTRVTLAGRYLHDEEVLIYTPSDYGPAFWVLTPLLRGDGTVVLVNRGVVPEAEARTGEFLRPQGEVRLTGLLRLSEDHRWLFARRNAPEAGTWYRRDVGSITEAKGLARAAPYFVDVERVGDAWPRGGRTVVRFRNAHLSYALTWFALAAVVATGYVLVLRLELRRG
ncbi:surfeit locus 1 family protein [Pseudooceanicola antarcticus]|uniref:SURF1-like protein n=2 Tax=Pseudooceanicola antarcticus TaxID=1247613 RepID=A0A285ISV1_9RHOB|nr:SURF1 family protein [Pseudooceanicola antarcticus]SNY50757.1 surfeit locus 1 family protein [Pseudooceanicola antarcticus]